MEITDYCQNFSISVNDASEHTHAILRVHTGWREQQKLRMRILIHDCSLSMEGGSRCGNSPSQEDFIQPPV